MACARFTRNRQSSCSVRDAPGLICQGCARSVPRVSTPLPPGLSQVFILKGVKVLCFDTLLQVFILKVLASRKYRSSQRLKLIDFTCVLAWLKPCPDEK